MAFLFQSTLTRQPMIRRQEKAPYRRWNHILATEDDQFHPNLRQSQ